MIIAGRIVALRVAAFVVGLIALVLVTGLLVRSCDARRSRAAQARVERSQTDAASNSAADAIGTVAKAGEATAASEAMTRENERTIRDADGANDKVKPGVRDAGIASLCRRPVYINSERCKLLKHPAR